MSYVPLKDVIFQGDTRAVTPEPGDNDTSLATTAFVSSEVGNYLPLSGGTLTGSLTLDPGADLTMDEASTFHFGGVSVTQYDATTLKVDNDFAAGGNLVAMQGLDEEVVIGNAGPGGMAAGMTFGMDANLYRFDANVLKTDSDLTVAGAFEAESPTTLGDTVLIQGKATIDAGVSLRATTASGAITANPDVEHIYLVDVSGGSATVTLPADHTLGDTVVIKDHTGNCEANEILVQSDDGDLIDGNGSFTLTVNYQAITLVSDGTNWALI